MLDKIQEYYELSKLSKSELINKARDHTFELIRSGLLYRIDTALHIVRTDSRRVRRQNKKHLSAGTVVNVSIPGISALQDFIIVADCGKYVVTPVNWRGWNRSDMVPVPLHGVYGFVDYDEVADAKFTVSHCASLRHLLISYIMITSGYKDSLQLFKHSDLTTVHFPCGVGSYVYVVENNAVARYTVKSISCSSSSGQWVLTVCPSWPRCCYKELFLTSYEQQWFCSRSAALKKLRSLRNST